MTFGPQWFVTIYSSLLTEAVSHHKFTNVSILNNQNNLQQFIRSLSSRAIIASLIYLLRTVKRIELHLNFIMFIYFLYRVSNIAEYASWVSSFLNQLGVNTLFFATLLLSSVFVPMLRYTVICQRTCLLHLED